MTAQRTKELLEAILLGIALIAITMAILTAAAECMKDGISPEKKHACEVIFNDD